MALGFYRAEIFGGDYYIRGLKDGFQAGWEHKLFLSMKPSYRKSHSEKEVIKRRLLIPEQLLTFNTTETETEE